MVQRTFGAKMTPDDVYAADLISALGAIDTGVTCVLDWSHIHNTPEHTDAVIKGLAGFRRARGVRLRQPAERNRPGRESRRVTNIPSDIARLRKQYFSSEDQLMTLYLAAPSGAPEVILHHVQGGARRGRPHQHPRRRRRIRRNGLLEKLNAAQRAEIGHHLYPLLHAQR